MFVNGVTIIDGKGNAIGVVGAPDFGAGWPTDAETSQWRIVQGEPPRAAGQVASTRSPRRTAASRSGSR